MQESTIQSVYAIDRVGKEDYIYMIKCRISATFAIILSVFLIYLNINLIADDSRDGSRFLQIKRITSNININGRLDESVWLDAPAIGELIQVEPVEGGVPTRKTDVKILFDDNYLYIGIICYEDSPDDIISHTLERDGDYETGDSIAIALDTFLDHSNGYLFILTPDGAKIDGTILQNSDEISVYWDGIWYAETAISSAGWTAEIAIPFQTLTFSPRIDTWGFNFQRTIKRNEEIIRWAFPNRNAYITNLASAGELRGITDIKQGLGLDVRPFAVATAHKDEMGESDESADAGVDFFYNATANLKASFTVNTDFAETEVDSRQINLTRYPITYPEKRDFFLEGDGYFKLQKMAHTIIPFFSRRVGLFQGMQVPISWGAKMTGRVGPYNIGFLDVQTKTLDSLESQNLLALRVTRELLDQSYIGMIFTNGDPSGIGYNRLYGADFHFGTSNFAGNSNLFFDANYIFTESEYLPDEKNDTWLIAVDYPNDKLNIYFEVQSIGDNFNPALGFSMYKGVTLMNNNFSYMPRPDWDFLRKMEFGWHISMLWDDDGELLETNLGLNLLELIFESGDEVSASLVYKYDFIDEDFEISDGIIIPPGEYSYFNYSFNLETSEKRALSGYLYYQAGDYYEGERKIFNLGIGYKPNEHTFLSAALDYYDISLPAGDFTAEIYSMKFNYNFSTDLSWKNIVQYDSDSKILGIFSKLRWIVEEGNELYFVVERNWIKEDESFISYDWRVGLKFYYTFRL